MNCAMRDNDGTSSVLLTPPSTRAVCLIGRVTSVESQAQKTATHLCGCRNAASASPGDGYVHLRGISSLARNSISLFDRASS